MDIAEKMESDEFNVEQSPSSILLEVSQLLSRNAKALQQSKGRDQRLGKGSKWRPGDAFSSSTSTSTALSSDDDEGTQ